MHPPIFHFTPLLHTPLLDQARIVALILPSRFPCPCSMPTGPLPPWRFPTKPARTTHRGSRCKAKTDDLRAVQHERRVQKRGDGAMHDPSDGDPAARDVEHRDVRETPQLSATQAAQRQSATHVALQSATHVAQPPSSATQVAAGKGPPHGYELESMWPADRERTIKYIEVFEVPLRATSDSEDDWSV